jgi:hypothetical protein
MTSFSAIWIDNSIAAGRSRTVQGTDFPEVEAGARSPASITGLIESPTRQASELGESSSGLSAGPAVPGRYWTMLLVVWVLSAVYVGVNLKHGWIPHDDGAFAQSAERVLHGELPHRDFDEIYTGGLAFLHALAFRVFGVSLAPLRYVLFAFFLAWVPAVYYIASRFADEYSSAAITLLAVAWSIPNYSAAVPSWYNLFFAVFGTAALLRYIDSRAYRWIFVAGVCAGLSILAKIVGLYFVAAALLFFSFFEQSNPSGPSSTNEYKSSLKRDRVYPIALLAALATFGFLLAGMILRGPSTRGLIYFLVPPVALIIVVGSREFGSAATGIGNRFAAFMKVFLPFAAGLGVPLLVFLIPYIRSGSIPALIHGLFVLPTKRFNAAAVAPPNMDKMATMIPLAILLVIAYFGGKTVRIVCGAALGIYLGVVLKFSANDSRAYNAGWFSMATAIPAVTVLASVYLGVPRFLRSSDPSKQQRVMLLSSVLAMTSIVQFPFSAPIYFCYVAPILILAFAALVSVTPLPPKFALGVLLAFYLLFAAWRITPAFVYNMGVSAAPYFQTQPLNLPRGGNVLVDPVDADNYEQLIPFIQSHSSSDFTYAGPDCAEIYFLTGLKNPTRTLFDSFDDPVGRNERILQAIDAHRITAITFDRRPGFAGLVNRELEQAVATAFPHSKQFGRFLVRWRD